MQRDLAGFTLIELLTALAVLIMVSAISVPSLTQMLEQQRIEAAMQRLQTDLALARNSAMTRRQPVVVCPLDAAGECRPGLDWSGGWRVFVAQREHPEQVVTPLWIQPPFAAAGFALQVSATRPLLRYRHDGTSPGSNLTLHLCLRGRLVAQHTVSNSGRARLHQPSGELPCPE